jgi:hypothetical protein
VVLTKVYFVSIIHIGSFPRLGLLFIFNALVSGVRFQVSAAAYAAPITLTPET